MAMDDSSIGDLNRFEMLENEEFCVTRRVLSFHSNTEFR